MQIVETKNNLVKITFNPQEERLVLAGFVTINDNSQRFIAQVINLDAKSNKHYAILKMLFSFDENNIISAYNGAIPALSSVIDIVDVKDVLGLFSVANPLFFGSTDNVPYMTDFDILKQNLLVCVENNEEKEDFMSLVSSQIFSASGKVVIFDLNGSYPEDQKFFAGKDFKLPLNYDTINFIYDKGLTDCSAETKALIQEIFLELQNYVKEIPEQFIPFDNFKAVVDAQYEETQLNELVLLKNKLLKFYEQGVFAQDKIEFDVLKNFLTNSSAIIIDVSGFDGTLQREIISYVYSTMKELNNDFYSLLEIDDDNTDKKLLKQVFVTQNVYTTIIAPYKYKYLKEIKQLSKNLVLFAPIQQQDDFAGYNVFLSKLNHGECIIYGKNTRYIPFLVALPDPNVMTDEEEPQIGQQEMIQNEPISQEQTIQYQHEEPSLEQEFAQAQQEEPLEQEFNQVQQDYNSVQDFEESPVQENYAPVQEEEVYEPIQQNDFEQVSQPEVIQPQYDDEDVEPVVQDDVQPNFAQELYQAQETQSIIQDEEIAQPVYSDVEQEIINDIDALESTPASAVKNNDESLLTDEDLDFIEENMTPSVPPMEQQPQEPQAIPQDVPQAQEFRETPIVPVYPAETPEQPKSHGEFAQGDVVMHETYGRGVINKIISYGDKILCSIQFDESGKKLLDPSITLLKKI